MNELIPLKYQIKNALTGPCWDNMHIKMNTFVRYDPWRQFNNLKEVVYVQILYPM